jgi:TolB protein
MDDDGYMVTVDGGSARSVAANGSVTISPLPTGDRSVQLNEVASNCAVGGDNPRSVTVTANGTSETTFDVACGPPLPPAAGKIAFTSGRNSEQIWPDQIFTMNGTGAEVTQITDSPEWGVGDIRLSPDGSRILFRACNEVLCDLWIVNADGTGLSRLTDDGTGGLWSDWSPDGTKIAFAHGRPTEGWTSAHGIDVINADGMSRVELSPFGSHPDWSPDGTRIVFHNQCGLPESPDPCTGDSRWNLWVMNSDGTGLTQLTDFGSQPKWSPDGSKIAFKDSPEQVWIVNPNGTDLTRLADGWRPAWSPDGSKIAFTFYDRPCEVTLNCSINVMNVDGTGLTRLLHSGVGPYYVLGQLEWSPDGRKIAFTMNDWEVYTINPDATGLTNITNHPAEDKLGSWGP